MDFFAPDYYHKPTVCEKCGGTMIFKGIGEYRCEQCGFFAYDDYGVVRQYIESHRGATAAQISAGTGIPQKTIRQMLKDDKLEVTKDSMSFLYCELCGGQIRSGRLCSKCQTDKMRLTELKKREEKKTNMQGHAMGTMSSKGEKRFRHHQ